MTLLDARALSKSFSGLRALDNVSFQVARGQIVSIIGPNGAGKSTLLNAISGATRLSSGQVSFDGHDITGMPSHRICSMGLARTFQLVQIFTDMTVLQNVMVGCHTWTRGGLLGCGVHWPLDWRDERRAADFSRELLSRFGLEKKCSLPAKHLSYGEQRVLQITRALAARPSLLMLDEPAAGLNDFEQERLTEQLLDVRARGVTLVLVEHHMGLVMSVSDWIVVLDFGECIVQGTPQTIRCDPRVIRAYLGEEAEDAAIG